MAVLKKNDIRKMDKKTRKAKLEELKIELIKLNVSANKSNVKTKELKKAIARLITLNRPEKGQELKKK